MKIIFTCLCIGLVYLLAGCETGLGRIYGGGTIGNSGVRGAGIGINIDLADRQNHRGLFFTEREEDLIRNYYRETRQIPKYATDPADNKQPIVKTPKQAIRIGQVLPGLQIIPLPVDLENRLHELPGDYVRVIVGSDIVLINKPDRVVHDVLTDVLM